MAPVAARAQGMDTGQSDRGYVLRAETQLLPAVADDFGNLNKDAPGDRPAGLQE
jgi:hypothetical protein